MNLEIPEERMGTTTAEAIEKQTRTLVRTIWVSKGITAFSVAAIGFAAGRLS